jgi:hypothetical protein
MFQFVFLILYFELLRALALILIRIFFLLVLPTTFRSTYSSQTHSFPLTPIIFVVLILLRFQFSISIWLNRTAAVSHLPVLWTRLAVELSG